MFIVAQVLGFLAISTYLLSYQFKTRNQILWVNALSSILYVFQYIALGAFEGAALDFLSATATITANQKDKPFIAKRAKFFLIAFDLLFLLVGLLLYKNIFSLFSIAGVILQTSAFWITNERIIRLISFAGAPFWLVYNLASRAYPSALGSLLCIISIGIAIYRYDIAPRRKT